MRDHIKILGILNMVMAGFTACAGVFIMLVMGGVAALVAKGADSDSAWVVPLVGVIGLGVAIFLIALAIPALIGGWGLLKYKSWSRILMIVVSALNLLHVPLGTALGAYGLWVLTNDQSRQLLESGGTLPPQTFPMQQQPMGYPPQGV